MINLPNKIPVFPLSNLIIFPETTIPLNIFEPRYIQMIDDSIKTNSIIGMIQPKKILNDNVPELHDIGCLGKITEFKKSSDGTYSINLTGLSRFRIIKEIFNNKPYRECEISFKEFGDDINSKKEPIKFEDLELIFKDLRILFEKKGYIINWKALEKQDLTETINALAMASPFSIEEKQILLEAENLVNRKNKISKILTTYSYDNFNNNTIQ